MKIYVFMDKMYITMAEKAKEGDFINSYRGQYEVPDDFANKYFTARKEFIKLSNKLHKLLKKDGKM